MEDMFKSDPVFQHMRDSRGRYCTKERAEYERMKKENRYLRLLVEKYKRQAEVTNDKFIASVMRLRNEN